MNNAVQIDFQRWLDQTHLIWLPSYDFNLKRYVRDDIELAYRAFKAGRESVAECDAQTTTSPCGKKITSCGSTQMASAVAEGHAFTESRGPG
jgi:hypothetical protein